MIWRFCSGPFWAGPGSPKREAVIALALFIAGCLAVFYILLGYPLLLALLRPKERTPVRKDPGFRTTVSIVVAVYNGEKFIAAKLASLLALAYPLILLPLGFYLPGERRRLVAAGRRLVAAAR